MLPSNIAGVRPAAGHKQNLATVPRVVAAAVQEKARLCLWLIFQRPLHMVKARLEKWEQLRERCPTVQLLVRRQHVRLVAHARRHIDGSARASAHRGPVGGRGTPPNRRGASRQDAIAASKIRVILRSTTPSYFGESTGVYSRRIRWWSSSVTNSPLVNSAPLSERRHFTMDGVPYAQMSTRKPAKTAGTSDNSLRK